MTTRYASLNVNSTLLDRVIQNRLASHILFWATFLGVFTILASLNSGYILEHFINYLALLPIQMMAAYLMAYYQVPRLLLQKKYIYFAISCLLFVYIFAALARISVVYIAEPFFRSDFEQESIIEIISDPSYLLAVYFPVVYVIVFLMLAVKAFKERFEEKHQMEVLQKEKATNELKFLKAQIHPHFLFNTLNNLYALTLAKSDVAPKVVVKLSEMLDYILYQCNEPTISIDKELELLEGYADLERLRYGKELEMVFTHQIDEPSTQIAPLILLSILENAFTHGASGNPVNPIIQIDLQVQNQQLSLTVFNTKSAINPKKMKPEHRNGIGKTNVKRQLELNYPNRHELKIEDSDDSYHVSLKISLN